MTDFLSRPATAFAGMHLLARGALVDVALAVKGLADPGAVLTFDDTTGKVIDLDLRGTTADMIARLTDRGRGEAGAADSADGRSRSRGRPKLGVVAREVTLLPRHWEWLSAQPGGASQALRRLVDKARQADAGQTAMRAARERTYQFLSALAGDLSGFEAASRALFAGDEYGFVAAMAPWPRDLRDHALRLSRAGGEEGA